VEPIKSALGSTMRAIETRAGNTLRVPAQRRYFLEQAFWVAPIATSCVGAHVNPYGRYELDMEPRLALA
jgi:hypothetical protein